jgi:ABC-type dipeptide/oligopeptide/nickel transport system permease component
MQVYLLRRLLALIPALFFASVIVRLVPGNIIDLMLAQNDVGADKLTRDQLVATLDRPSQRDYPIITGVSLVIGFCVMLINLVVDLSYGLLDPKVRYR